MKKLFSIALVILTITTSYSQFSYMTINSQSVNKRIDCIASDKNGNTIITGNYEQTITFGSFTLTSNPYVAGGRNAAFVVKMAANGTFTWAKAFTPVTINGNSYVSFVQIHAITTDAAGSIFLTGRYVGKISFNGSVLTSTKNGSNYTDDAFTVKMSAAGAVIWLKSEGSNLEDPCALEWGKSITTDTVGNTYITGNLIYKIYKNSGACTCGPNTVVTSAFVIKYNSIGTKVWQKTYFSSTASASVCQGIVNGNSILSDGRNVFVTGQIFGSVSFGSVTLNTGGVSNTYVAKLDENGNTLWAKAASGSNNTSFATGDGIFLENNDVYIRGQLFSGTISFGGCSLTFDPLKGAGYFAKFSASSGACSWAISSRGLSHGVVRHPNGNLAMLLRSKVFVNGFGWYDIMEFSRADGSYVDSTVAAIEDTATASVKVFSGLAGTPTGFVFSQNLEGTYDFGNITISSVGSAGYPDMILVKYTTPPPPGPIASGIITKTISPKVVVYPNPANDQITIRDKNKNKLGNITIYDATGKVVYQKFLEESQANIDISNLSTGIFYLRFNEFSTVRIIKQ